MVRAEARLRVVEMATLMGAGAVQTAVAMAAVMAGAMERPTVKQRAVLKVVLLAGQMVESMAAPLASALAVVTADLMAAEMAVLMAAVMMVHWVVVVQTPAAMDAAHTAAA